MKTKKIFSDFIIPFCVVTTCINLLEGVLGCLMMPDIQFGFEAYFSPLLFGLLSTLIIGITQPSKELSIKQMIFRDILQLLLIELMVFGINFLFGQTFEPKSGIVLALGIAVIFFLVYAILWHNDKRSAIQFNKDLKIYQEKQNSSAS